jgi:hypothetical protein
MSAVERAKFQGSRASLAHKIVQYRDLQHAHMPGLERTPTEEGSTGQPEEFILLLPSSLIADRRAQAYEGDGLIKTEEALREAAAHQALDDVRRHLLTRTALYADKRQGAQSVAAAGRTQASIKAAQARVMAGYHRYRRHWAVLDALRPQNSSQSPSDWRDDLRPLSTDDLIGLNTNEAALQEKESILRAKALAQSAGPSASTTDLSDGSTGAVELLSDPYQHGQQGRKISWIWPHAELGGHARDSRQRLGELLSCCVDLRADALSFSHTVRMGTCQGTSGALARGAPAARRRNAPSSRLLRIPDEVVDVHRHRRRRARLRGLGAGRGPHCIRARPSCPGKRLRVRMGRTVVQRARRRKGDRPRAAYHDPRRPGGRHERSACARSSQRGGRAGGSDWQGRSQRR